MSSYRDLSVYKKARNINRDVYQMLKSSVNDRNIDDQLRRASTSIMLNIAEGAGRMSRRDKRNFYVIARASAMECMSLLDILEDLEMLGIKYAEDYRKQYEEISKMLFGMIRNLQ